MGTSTSTAALLMNMETGVALGAPAAGMPADPSQDGDYAAPSDAAPLRGMKPAGLTRTRAPPRAGIEPMAVRLPEAELVSGFSRSEIYRRAGRGEIILLKCGNRTLVDMASLRAAVAALPRATVRAPKAA